jgi:hypothetical protein
VVGKEIAVKKYVGDLVGDAQCQRANVLGLDGKCERPSLPKHCELLACFLDAALPLDLTWRCHSRAPLRSEDHLRPGRSRCQAYGWLRGFRSCCAKGAVVARSQIQ